MLFHIVRITKPRNEITKLPKTLKGPGKLNTKDNGIVRILRFVIFNELKGLILVNLIRFKIRDSQGQTEKIEITTVHCKKFGV